MVLVLVVSAYWERKQTPFQDAPKLISALQAFSRDQAAAGRRLPPEVSLQDLLRGGYLTTNDVRAFEGMEVAFSTQADESHPLMILARARMPQTASLSALWQMAAFRGLAGRGTEELRANLGQQEGAADGSRAVQFRDESAIRGGWLPPLTFYVNMPARYLVRGTE